MRRHESFQSTLYAVLLLLSIGHLSLLGAPASVHAIRLPDINMPDERATLGKYVPNIRLFDSKGTKFSLYELMDDKPLAVSFIYTRCVTACLVITDGLKDSVSKLEGLGEDFRVLSLSFDPRDMVHDLEKFRGIWELDGKDWVVAAGDEDEVVKFLDAVQFEYEDDKITGELVHPNFIVILTPDGRISKYIYGVNPDLKNLKLSLLEAKRGSSSFSPLTDGLLLKCYRYDAATGTFMLDYAFIVEVVMGALTITTIFLVVWGKGVYRFIFRRRNRLESGRRS